MDKKIIWLFFISLIVILGCNSNNCYIGPVVEVKKKYEVPDDTWFDNIEIGRHYKYFFESTTGLKDVLQVRRTDLYKDGGWNNCEKLLYANARVSCNSQNYGYTFHFELKDTDADNKGEIEIFNKGVGSGKWGIRNHFYFNLFDTSNHEQRIKNYTNDDTLYNGGISLLPEFTTNSGLKFNNVYMFQPEVAKQLANDLKQVATFYATKEFGVIEFKTNGGIIFSFTKRE